MIDLVIRNGEVVDGSGAPPYRADIAVHDGRIAEVGYVAAPPGADTIDAAGLVVAPGFIDIHSHSDWTLLADPRAISSISQGVTLEVVGNCGHGCAPLGDPALAAGNIYGYRAGAPLDWSGVAGYLERLEAARPAVNVAVLVPNGCLRLAVTGMADRQASAAELARMKLLLAEGLEAGAFGYSTGLEYAAERGCSEDEITQLCAVAARMGGLYATHTRNQIGRAGETIDEALRTAARSGARLQISHIGVVARLEPDSRGAVERALAQVELARRQGLDVGFDMHTRLFGTTNLSAALPSWALLGGSDALRDRLRDPVSRARMQAAPNIVSALAGDDWERIVVFSCPAHPELARLSVAAIGRLRGTSALDTIYDLLLEHVDDIHAPMILAYTYREEDMRLLFAHDDCMVGSDATALAPDGPLAGMSFHGAYTWAAWFVRYLAGQTRLLNLEQAVRRLTSLPAARLGLSDRGTLRPGCHADVVVFDPRRFAERGTIFEPNRTAVGMAHVLVNGVVTVRDGAPTGARGGRVLRSTR